MQEGQVSPCLGQNSAICLPQILQVSERLTMLPSIDGPPIPDPVMSNFQFRYNRLCGYFPMTPMVVPIR